MKKAIAIIIFYAIGIAIAIRIASCGEREKHPQFIRFTSPLYNPSQPLIWNASKLSGLVTGSFDAASTTRALRRGYAEKNVLDNAWIGSRDPAFAKRQASSLMIQYGFNFLLDYGFRRAGTKKEKAILIGVRWALTGMSIWAAHHNNSLR